MTKIEVEIKLTKELELKIAELEKKYDEVTELNKSLLSGNKVAIDRDHLSFIFGELRLQENYQQIDKQYEIRKLYNIKDR